MSTRDETYKRQTCIGEMSKNQYVNIKDERKIIFKNARPLQEEKHANDGFSFVLQQPQTSLAIRHYCLLTSLHISLRIELMDRNIHLLVLM